MSNLYLNIDDYKEYIDKGDYESVIKDLEKKGIVLAKYIVKLRKIEIDDYLVTNELFHIRYIFEHNTVSFRDVCYLMNKLEYFDMNEDFFDTKKDRVELIIKCYNSLLDEIEYYKRINKDIETVGYKVLKDRLVDKLITIFKEMLDYKHKEYKDDWSFREFANKISQYYNLFSGYLSDCVNAIYYGSYSYDIDEDHVSMNNVEKIMVLEGFYDRLTYSDDAWKKEANFYRDFDLEEGQTLKDLFDIECEKFIKLFKEMLDYRNFDYDKEETYLDFLKRDVVKAYPFYEDNLRFLISPNPSSTYIEILDHMENVYEYLVGDYKNYEVNIKKYNKYLEEHKDDNDEEYIDIEDDFII